VNPLVAPLSGTTATKRRSDCLAPTCTAWRSTPVTTGSTGHPPRPVPLRRDLPDQGRPGDRPDGIHHRRAEPLLRLRTPRRRHRPAESGGPDREHRPRSDLETSCPRGVSPTSTRSLPPTGVLGNDGTLLASQDGRQWPDLQLPLPPTALAASPDGRTVLAATDAGLLRSTDAAQTWAAPPGAPPLKVLSWAEGHDGRATFDGAVHVSIDTGLTWQGRGRTAPPQAITAADAAAGLRVLVVTAEEVFDSVDGGITFTSLKNPGR
jgi:photosystem II stability/assembly factor-like uncharacterized protein